MAFNRIGLCLAAMLCSGLAIAALTPKKASADTSRTARSHDALMAISSGSHLQLIRTGAEASATTAPQLMRCRHVVTIVGVQFGLRCTRV